MPSDFRGLTAACKLSLDELEGVPTQIAAEAKAGRVTLKDGRIADVFVTVNIDVKASKKIKPAPEEVAPVVRRRRGRRRKK